MFLIDNNFFQPTMFEALFNLQLLNLENCCLRKLCFNVFKKLFSFQFFF